jgi:hypothetical protein
MIKAHAAVVVLLLAGTPAYAQSESTAPPPPPYPSAPAYSATPAPAPGYQTDERTAEGEIRDFDPIGRTMTLDDGTKLDFPDSFAMTSPPAVGEEVKVSYYVAQDGRNIVRSIDMGYAGNRG